MDSKFVCWNVCVIFDFARDTLLWQPNQQCQNSKLSGWPRFYLASLHDQSAIRYCSVFLVVFKFEKKIKKTINGFSDTVISSIFRSIVLYFFLLLTLFESRMNVFLFQVNKRLNGYSICVNVKKCAANVNTENDLNKHKGKPLMWNRHIFILEYVHF